MFCAFLKKHDGYGHLMKLEAMTWPGARVEVITEITRLHSEETLMAVTVMEVAKSEGINLAAFFAHLKEGK